MKPYTITILNTKGEEVHHLHLNGDRADEVLDRAIRIWDGDMDGTDIPGGYTFTIKRIR